MTAMTLLVLALAAGDGGPAPQSSTDFLRARSGTALAYTFLPGEQPLRPEEVERWIRLLGLPNEQAPIVRRMYEDFAEKVYNPLLGKEMPRYIEQAAAAATALQADGGVRSASFQQAFADEHRSAIRLSELLTGAELGFVASLETVLTPAQAERLPLLRSAVVRRRASAVAWSDRWVKIELRNTWGDTAGLTLTPSERAAIDSALDAYEIELGQLLDQRRNAVLDASRRMMRFLAKTDPGSGADAAADAEDPARIWSAKARLSAAVRELQLRTNERLLASVDADVAAELRCRSQAVLFPELYPDAEATTVRACFRVLMDDASQPEAVRATRSSLLGLFEDRYREFSRKLEQASIEYDKGIESEVGNTHAEERIEVLRPLLEARRGLCLEWKLRCGEQTAVMNTVLREDDGAERTSPAR